MKIREMDVYFTVPVDRDALKACRVQAGYKTVAAFGRELKSKGYSMNYSNIECNYTKGSSNIRGDVAEVIAAVLGMPVTLVFPQYDAAKAAKEQHVEDNYYKPFTTIEERNTAIVAAMPVARGAAYKYCRFLRTKQNGYDVFVPAEEVKAIAYEALVCEADRAMKKGIKKGVRFEAAVYIAVKNAFLRMYGVSQQVSRKAFVVSLDAYTTHRDSRFDSPVESQKNNAFLIDPSSLEEHVLLREEARQAVLSLPEEKRQDKHIQQLVAICFPQGVAYA